MHSYLSECGLRTGSEALKKGTDMVVHAHNPSTGEVEAGKSVVLDHPWLHSKFEPSLGYIVAYTVTLTMTTEAVPLIQRAPLKDTNSPV